MVGDDRILVELSTTLVSLTTGTINMPTYQYNVLITLNLVLQVPKVQIWNVRWRERIVFLALMPQRSPLLLVRRAEMWRRQRRLVLQGRTQADLPLPAHTR